MSRRAIAAVVLANESEVEVSVNRIGDLNTAQLFARLVNRIIDKFGRDVRFHSINEDANSVVVLLNPWLYRIEIDGTVRRFYKGVSLDESDESGLRTDEHSRWVEWVLAGATRDDKGVLTLPETSWFERTDVDFDPSAHMAIEGVDC